MKINKLSIIIPIYNEEELISTVIVKIQKINLGKVKKEIIIVNDGSTDNTRRVLKKYPSCKIIHHQKNKGKGAAIRTALKYVTGDYVIIQDADLEYDPGDIPKIIKFANLNKSLVVYGSRFLNHNMQKFPEILKYGGALLAKYTNFLYGTKLTDEATGYKLFNSGLLKSLDLKCNRFDFCPEVTAKIAKRRIKIHEVSISYIRRSPKEGKKLKLFPDAIQAIWVLLKQRII